MAKKITEQELNPSVTNKLKDASLTTKGIVQLSSSTTSTDESTAATPKAVKAAYDLASSANATASAALPASSYTADDVLTKLKTVDGSGSGLDADTLDGKDAAAFMLAGTADTDVSFVKAAQIETDQRSTVYTYDSNGNIATIEEKSGSTVVKTTTYTYDAISGNVSTKQEVAGGTTVTTSYSYDADGNLTGKTKA